MNWRLETGNMLVSLVILSLPAQAMTDNNDKTISRIIGSFSYAFVFYYTAKKKDAFWKNWEFLR